MPTWHQERPDKPLPKLTHPTLWRSYNPSGHLSVTTFDTQEQCLEYCRRSGEVALPPDNYVPGSSHRSEDEQDWDAPRG